MGNTRVPFRSGGAEDAVSEDVVGLYTGCDRDLIWCLGTKIDGCRSVSWHDRDISFADCDVLIVTVGTLDKRTLDGLDTYARDSLSTEICKRFNQNQLLIVCIMAETIYGGSGFSQWHNYFWCPVKIGVQKIAQGATRLQSSLTEANLAHFKPYFDSMNEYDIGIVQSNRTTEYPAMTRSGDVVGCIHDMGYISDTSHICDTDYIRDTSRADSYTRPSPVLVFLPPLRTLAESVNKVLEILDPTRAASAPAWAEKIPISGADDIHAQIAALGKEISTKRQEVAMHKRRLSDLLQYRRLVYAHGSELESVVERALKLLGIKGLEQGEKGKEDFMFRPQTHSDYPICVIEVKGTQNQINRDHLRQLGNWVDDHYSKLGEAKGLLIANAFSSQDVVGPRSKQSVVSDDNLGYAEKKKFCILPTTVLLGLCNKVLKDDAVPADKIEHALMSTSGVVSLDDFA